MESEMSTEATPETQRKIKTKLGILVIGFLGVIGLILTIGPVLQAELTPDAKFIGGCILVHQFWTIWAHNENLR
jgi:hypothetical protein